ncbi:MAG: PfkB family carbohydrate kinase [Chloroflexota bacterium]|nr:PfkB family carbohydrate kinase [Chloroflexota bacterium]
MLTPSHYPPIDYLVIGHITIDLTSKGLRLGGTATYAALTAQALGLRVGIVTIWGEEIPLGPLSNTSIAGITTKQSTTFENIQTHNGRVQILHHLAPPIDFELVPKSWQDTPIIHLGPIAQEVKPILAQQFPKSSIYTTAQGWLRDWDESGRVHLAEWDQASLVLERSDATILSNEDIDGNKDRIEEMAASSKMLVITEGARGARIHWRGTSRNLPAPNVREIDATGAGDIFAATFFIHLHQHGNPWNAAAHANQLAAQSVTQIGLNSIPKVRTRQLAR